MNKFKNIDVQFCENEIIQKGGRCGSKCKDRKNMAILCGAINKDGQYDPT